MQQRETTRMPWFKWWDGTAADPKFRMLAEEVKIPVASILGVWSYLLEQASRHPDRGTTADVDVGLMAYVLQMSAGDVETVRNGMKRVGLVTETGELAKWDDRQAKRERSEPAGASTDRVQRFREKQKAAKNNDLGSFIAGNAHETHETAGNGTKHPKRKNREEVEEEGRDNNDAPRAALLPMRESPPASEDPAIVMTVQLRRQGVTALFTHPAVQGWAQQGVTAEVLTQAIAVARESKGEASIPVNYLVPIVADLLNPKAARPLSQSRAAPVNEKFNFGHLDRSGDKRAMAESMKRNGIVMPADDEEIEI